VKAGDMNAHLGSDRPGHGGYMRKGDERAVWYVVGNIN